jgi:hypothetical protein
MPSEIGLRLQLVVSPQVNAIFPRALQLQQSAVASSSVSSNHLPLTVNLEMRQCAKFHRFDQHVIEVDVNAGLTESVESRSRASTTNEPGLEVLFRRVVEFARFPHIIAMTADEVRSAIAVRLGVNNQPALCTAGWRMWHKLLI